MRRGRPKAAPTFWRSLLFFLFLLLKNGSCGYGIIVVETEQANSLRGATGFADLVGVNADDLALLGDDHDVGFFGNLQGGNDRTVAFGGLDVDNTLTSARGDAVFGERSTLAITSFGDGEHEGGQRVLDLLVFEFFKIGR